MASRSKRNAESTYYVPQSKGAAAKWVIIEEEFKQESGKSTLVCTCMCVSNTMCEWVIVFKVFVDMMTLLHPDWTNCGNCTRRKRKRRERKQTIVISLTKTLLRDTAPIITDGHCKNGSAQHSLFATLIIIFLRILCVPKECKVFLEHV